MKKKLCIFALLVMCVLIIKAQGVWAVDINTINYYDCKNLDSNPVSSYGYKEEVNTTKCKDKDFVGWEVMFYDNQKAEYGRFCVNGVEYYGSAANSFCKQGSQIFSNGFSTSELNNTVGYGKIFLYALTDSTVDSFTAHFSAGTDEATGTMEDQVIVIGSKTKLHKNQFKLEGYSFTGWHAYMNDDKGKKVFMCEDGELSVDCSPKHCKENKDKQCIKIYHDEAVVSQTGNPGYIVTFQAIWKKGSANGGYTNNIMCADFQGDPDRCAVNNCSYNKEHDFCSVNGLVYLSCGEADDIPEMVPVLVSLGVTGLKTVAPIVLIIMSIIQLVRSITSGKEDDIKKAQTGLIKRVISAVVVFFVIAIVQFIMLRVADSTEKDSLRKCLSCFLNGTDSCGSLYYKDESGNHINVK